MKANYSTLSRLLSVLLVLAMLLSTGIAGAFAATASAAEPEDPASVPETTAPADPTDSTEVTDPAGATEAPEVSQPEPTEETAGATEPQAEDSAADAEVQASQGITVYADDGTREAIYVGVPTDVADGVYYATINMKMASNPARFSMGNSAMRGSESFLAKHPEDTAYRPIVIVENGKATALLEFMPMGYLGSYGFMMELEGVYAGSFNRFGQPNTQDPATVFTATRTLAYHQTTDGKNVYDAYNDPDSQYRFNGNKLRPAGFGREESYVNIVDQPYSHLLALDVTPVMVATEGETAPTLAKDYSADQAAFCHVFVPVMFDISESSGDQYARMEVDWTNLTRISDPESNVQYMLYKASQTSTQGYTAASVAAFQEAYSTVRTKLENIWPKQNLNMEGSGVTAQPILDMTTYSAEEQKAMAQQLKAAIEGLSSTDLSALEAALAEAKAVKAALYTAESYKVLSDAMAAAETLLADSGAAQDAVDAQVQALKQAMENLEPVRKAEGWDGVTTREPESLSESSVTITSPEELAWLAQQVNGGRSFACVFLNEDIDLNGQPWTAIGTKDHPFTGEFYGNGHRVTNLLITANTNYQGLFGYVGTTSGTETASIQDLSVQGSIETTATDVGGVAGYAVYAKLTNLRSSVNITVAQVNSSDSAAYAGGIVGEAIRSTLTRCFNSGNITALRQEKAGGVVGYVSSSNVQYCGSTGSVTAGGCSGGVAGLFTASGGIASLIKCYNTGTVVSSGTFVGGIVGSVTVLTRNGTPGMAVLSDLYNRGDVTAQHTVGGLAGGIVGGDLSSLSASYSTGTITGTVDSGDSTVSALVGRLYSGQLSYSYALEGTAGRLYTLGTQNGTTTQIVSHAEFQSRSWLQSDSFFEAIGNFAEDFAKDTEGLNDGYPVLAFQNSDLLDAAKQAAIQELTAYRDLSQYKGLAKAAAQEVKEAALTAIQNAQSRDEVDALLAQAKADLDAIPNDPNYGLQLEALKEKLAQAKALEQEGGALYTQDSWNSFTATIAGIDYLLESGFESQEQVDKYLGYLSTNQENLTYREADYTAVDEALVSVPQDLSGYTDDSAAALQAAVAAVVRGKDITQQDQVDAMAQAIRTALSGLVKKDDGKDDEALDWSSLPDGVYALDFTMVKMNRTDLSMSNDAVNHTAKLEVKNGQYTLTVNFKGLHYLNRFGYLAKLSYYEDGYTYGSYGSVSGSLSAATVLATQKNSDGTDISDEFNAPGGVAEGQLYPLTVSFPVVNTAKADAEGLIPLHVFVPVMEDIAAGNGDQDVLMKLDKSSLKRVSQDDPSFEPEEPEELSPAVDVTDEKTGVTVHADKGVFPEGVRLVVTEITSGDAYTQAAKSLSEVGKKFRLYEVHFEDKDGNEVQPNGAVTVSYPVPADFTGSKLALYRINADGSKTLVKGSLDGSRYTVVTKSFSSYALVEKGSTTAANNGTNNGTKRPQTGDPFGIALFAALTAASAGALILVGARKRRFKEGE